MAERERYAQVGSSGGRLYRLKEQLANLVVDNMRGIDNQLCIERFEPASSWHFISASIRDIRKQSATLIDP